MFLVYLAIIFAVSLERILELKVSKRHELILLERGAFEVGQSHFGLMKLMHTLFLVACVGEAWFKDQPPSIVQFIFFTVVIVFTQMLRYWVIATLKERWTINVMILPNAPLVVAGPFKFVRHPNYLAVIFEMIALPMIFNGYITAFAFSVLNAALLFVRIRTEEQALGG